MKELGYDTIWDESGVDTSDEQYRDFVLGLIDQ